MPRTKEQQREYLKEYRDANKEKIKEQKKEYYQKNKEKIKEYYKEYHKTPQGKRFNSIKNWKNIGIICDYQHYYKIYLQQTNCYYCRKEFKNTKDRHLDHNHSITDYYNVRGILCRSCNIKDVYKI